MSKIKVLGLAFVAMVAFGAFSASSAFATGFTVSAKSEVLEGTSRVTRLLDGSTELNCESSQAIGKVKTGRELTDIGTIEMATWNGGEETCEGPLGIEFSVNALTLEPNNSGWLVLAEGHENNEDLITGRIENIRAHISGFLCSFLVEGSVGATYHNSTQTLLITTANLLVSNVSGCFGLIKNGDKPVFDGSYVMAAGTDLLIKLS